MAPLFALCFATLPEDLLKAKTGILLASAVAACSDMLCLLLLGRARAARKDRFFEWMAGGAVELNSSNVHKDHYDADKP